MKRSAILRRTPLRRVSSKRAKQLREYAKLRAQFLIDHPFCEVWLARNKVSEARAKTLGGLVEGQRVPLSTEIHHGNRRHGDRLNDQRFWFAISRESHLWVHAHPAEAKAIGFFVCDTPRRGRRSAAP